MEDIKKAKQITFRIDNDGEKRQAAQVALPQLVQTFGGGAAGDIIAARRTAGRDIIFQTALVKAREELEKEDGWVRRHWGSARVLRKTVMVAVERVRRTMDTKDQRAVIETLKRGNKKLHPELEITKAEWPIFASKPDVLGKEKRFSTMMTEVPNPQVANRLIAEGMVVAEASRAALKAYRYSRDVHTETALRQAEREKVTTLRKVRTIAFREGVHKASLKPGGVWQLAN